jgi:hypothetical protein
MLLFFMLLVLPPEQQNAEEPIHLLERARELHVQIDEALREGRETRSICRDLLDVCVQLRKAVPTSVPLCVNEGHAASLAGDWPHALLAYRLAQRLAPRDAVVASRLATVRARLMLPDEPVSVWDEAMAALAANTRLRAAFCLLALFLYGAAWVRLAGLASRYAGSGIVLSVQGIVAAVAIIAALFWADDYQQRSLGQSLVVIKRGEPVVLREGNGLSYPAATEDRLKAGTEAILVNRRGNWLQVRTTHGLAGWIPSASAEVE